MHIEVNDEAARLRRGEGVIKCASEPDAASTSPAEPAAGDEQAECLDCGERVVVCRCNPGEG